ncbi:hypothetical protein LTR94_037109, partial [Friedmanniomyces endolithicus]
AKERCDDVVADRQRDQDEAHEVHYGPGSEGVREAQSEEQDQEEESDEQLEEALSSNNRK